MGFLGNAGGLQILLILVIILLIFGATRLPALAKSMGQSARAFKGEMKQMRDDGDKAENTADPQGDAKDDSSTASSDGGPSSSPKNT